jgi:hypothetical protein
MSGPALDAIPRFFREPPSLAPADLGLVLRFRGKPTFIAAEWVREVTPALPVAVLPETGGRGIAFWRGRVYPVADGGEKSWSHFVLVSRAGRDFFVATTEAPKAVGRSLAGADVEDFPEDM